MAKVTGIGGVFFRAQDPDALKAWYVQHLGVELEPWGGAVFHWKDDAEKQTEPGATVWHMKAPDSDWFPGGLMINYRVDDLDGLIAQLKDAGISLLKGPDEAFNGRFAWIEDPEGNRVELWQPQDNS